MLHIDFTLIFGDKFHIYLGKKQIQLTKNLLFSTVSYNSIEQFFLLKNVIVVCKETIHTTAHAFTNLSLKYSRFFCLSQFMDTIFPLKMMENLPCNEVRIGAFAFNRSKSFCFL